MLYFRGKTPGGERFVGSRRLSERCRLGLRWPMETAVRRRLDRLGTVPCRHDQRPSAGSASYPRKRPLDPVQGLTARGSRSRLEGPARRRRISGPSCRLPRRPCGCRSRGALRPRASRWPIHQRRCGRGLSSGKAGDSSGNLQRRRPAAPLGPIPPLQALPLPVVHECRASQTMCIASHHQERHSRLVGRLKSRRSVVRQKVLVIA